MKLLFNPDCPKCGAQMVGPQRLRLGNRLKYRCGCGYEVTSPANDSPADAKALADKARQDAVTTGSRQPADEPKEPHDAAACNVCADLRHHISHPDADEPKGGAGVQGVREANAHHDRRLRSLRPGGQVTEAAMPDVRATVRARKR